MPDSIPRLTDDIAPVEIVGTAILATEAMHGADRGQLMALIEAAEDDPTALLYDAAMASLLCFRRAEGLGFLDDALAVTPLFRVRQGATASLRLLALVAPGDLMANTPLDFITNHIDVRLDLLYLLPDQALPAAIPDHDVMFIAVGEADAALRARLEHLRAVWPRPVLNDPALLPRLERDKLAGAFSDVPGICSPKAIEISRTDLDALVRADATTALPGGYPFLIRPRNSHAGSELKKMDGPADLSDYLSTSFAKSYFVTAFIDYADAGGFYRKYRVAFIDREPHLCHMALSRHWMVHYLNAGMAESPAKRAEEAAAMRDFGAGFAQRHRAAFAALHAHLPFDFYSIDCSELPDGRLLLFEADTAAIIHLMDPAGMYPYKQGQMRGVFTAFGAMLARHARSPERRVRSA